MRYSPLEGLTASYFNISPETARWLLTSFYRLRSEGLSDEKIVAILKKEFCGVA